MDGIRVETPRLLLDSLSEDDAPRLLAYRSDPSVTCFQPFEPASLEDARRFIAEASWAAGDAGGGVAGDATGGDRGGAADAGGWRQLAIRLKATGELAGDAGVRLFPAEPQAEIGVTVAPEHQGRGIATEAVQALLAHLFGELRLHRVHASVDPRNAASMALFARLGFRREAHFSESLWFKGEWVDDVIFAMLRREWLG